MKLSSLIIDDEPSGRKVLEEYISETAFLTLAGKAENPLKALALMEKCRIDLIFLDIQMPKINGIDFLRGLKNPPLVIVSTAFSEYALQGFELDVIDYLVKPVPLDRFLKACHKAKEMFELRNNSAGLTDYFFVKYNGKFEKITHKELLYVEAANNYVLLQTRDRQLITYLTLKNIEDTLPPAQFIKIHKSFIVSVDAITSLNGEELRVGKYTLPISRSLKDEVISRIVSRSLLKR